MNTWKNNYTYEPGDLVLWNDKVYEKTNDNDQSPPDDVPGGWVDVTDQCSGLDQFKVIAQSFASYEQRVIEHQQKLAKAKEAALQKLSDLGLSQLEVEALLS